MKSLSKKIKRLTLRISVFNVFLVILITQGVSVFAENVNQSEKKPLQALQQNEVSGTITDSITGEPLIGINIFIEGTTTGTVSDISGNYSINATAQQVLVFSYIGYTEKKIVVGNQTVINVQLSPAVTALDEIIVVGYGTLNKKEVSSAITHISGDDLLTVGGNGALMSLQGRVAGLSVVNTATGDPNSSPSLQLRGVSSRNAGLEPLYVIDGIPGGNIDNLNQNNIESIDVLKGGAASAIYGTRGSNGVILITTKKGTSSSHTAYEDYFSLDFLNNKLEVLSAEDFVANNRGFDYGTKTNWQDELTRDYAFSQKHTLYFGGGKERSNYYASVDYRDAEGIDLRASKQEYGGRFNLTHSPENKRYTVSLNLAPRYLKSNNANYGSFAQALLLNPTQPVKDTANPNLYNNVKGQSGVYNPVEDLKTVLSGTEGKYLDWSGSFKFNILDNWNTQVSVSQSNKEFFDFYFRPSTNTIAINSNGGRNSASRAYNNYDIKNLEWITNYFFDYKYHSVKLLGGYSYTYYNNKGMSASNSLFPTDAFTYNNLGAGLYNLEEGENNVGSYQNDSRLIAFFGRLNYSFNNEVFFSASLRQEGSSKFGINKKWGSFPAVSAAWDISKYAKLGWINDLKIRTDYGVTGNQDFGNYLSLDTYTGYGYALYEGIYYQVYGPSQNTNYDLRWEKAINYNFGLDFELFQDKITGSINYYIRKNVDLLGYYNVPVPPNVQGSIYANVGSMQNTGVELQLTGRVIGTQDLNYQISLAGATLNNKFISFSNDTYQGQDYVDVVGLPAPGSPGTIQRLEEGRRVGSFYMLKSVGVDATGALLVYDKDGNIISANLASADDKQYVGNGLPKFTLSIGNTFRYKNLDASVNFRGAFGYDIFNTTAFYYGTPATALGSNVLSSAYDGTKYSYLTNGATLATASDYFLEKGDYLKLDNVTIGYTYPAKIKLINSVRVFITARNLYTFTNYTGSDPEMTTVNGLYPGVNPSVNYYPSTMQLLGGLQVKF